MARALNRLISLGVGVAVAGAVVKSTLYNGRRRTAVCVCVCVCMSEESLRVK